MGDATEREYSEVERQHNDHLHLDEEHHSAPKDENGDPILSELDEADRPDDEERFDAYFHGFYDGVCSILEGEADLANADEFTDAETAMEELAKRFEEWDDPEDMDLAPPFSE